MAILDSHCPIVDSYSRERHICSSHLGCDILKSNAVYIRKSTHEVQCFLAVSVKTSMNIPPNPITESRRF